MGIEIFPNNSPLGVNLGENGSTVTNLGPGTVSYNDVSTNSADGTIASGASASLAGTQYFYATVRCTLTTTPLSPAAVSGGSQIVADASHPNGTSDDTAYLAGLLATAIATRAQLRIPPATSGVWRISELTLPSNADVDATGATFKLTGDVAKRFLVNSSLKLGSPGTVRDTNIKWRGGLFDRAQVGGRVPFSLDGMNIMFGFVDGLRFIDTEHLQSHATDAGLFGLYLYNVTDFVIDGWKGASTAINAGTIQLFSGTNGTFRNIRGSFGDDIVALVPGNVTALMFPSFPDGTITNIRVENVFGTSLFSGVKVTCGTSAGPGTTVYRVADISFFNIQVTASYTAAYVGGDSGYIGLTGGTIENVTFDTVRNLKQNAPGISTHDVCTIRGLRLRNITNLETNPNIGLPVEFVDATYVEDVVVEDTAFTPGTQPVYLVNVDAGSTIGQLTLRNLRITAGQAGQATGPLKVSAGATVGSIIEENISVEYGGWGAGEIAIPTKLYLRGVATKGSGVLGYLKVLTGAAVDIREASLSAASGGDDFMIPTGETGTITSSSLGTRMSVAKAQTTSGSLAWNTRSDLGCGTGPVVCNGTLWTNLATGATGTPPFAAPPPFVKDTFTDTSATNLTSHTGETNATWTASVGGAGNFAISSANRLRKPVTVTAITIASGIPPAAEYDVQADFFVFSIIDGTTHGICGRHVSGLDTGYMVDHLSSGGGVTQQFRLLKMVNGSASVLGTFTQTLTVSQAYTVKLEIRDAAKKVYIDGTQRISSADNVLTAIGRVGVVARGSTAFTDSTGIHLDNFSVVNAYT